MSVTIGNIMCHYERYVVQSKRSARVLPAEIHVVDRWTTRIEDNEEGRETRERGESAEKRSRKGGKDEVGTPVVRLVGSSVGRLLLYGVSLLHSPSTCLQFGLFHSLRVTSCFVSLQIANLLAKLTDLTALQCSHGDL